MSPRQARDLDRGERRLRAAMLASVAVYATLLILSRPLRALGEPAAVIQGFVESGVLPQLRWQHFAERQEALRRFYAPGQFAPLWTHNGQPTAQAGALIANLAAADAKGLDAADYDATWLAAEAERLRTTGSPSDDAIGRFDVALTVSLMRFVSDSYAGRVDPHALGYGLDIEPKKIDLAAFVLDLVNDLDPAQRLAALDPPIPIYTQLQRALATYRALAARTDLRPVPNLPKLRPGESDAGVPLLRAWLAATGDLSAASSPPAQSKRYDPALVAAVKRFQRRHGLDADGVIGAGTLNALQVPPAERAHQIELALERLRWLPAQLPDRFLLINIPEFRLRGFEAAGPVPRVDMGVVVGSEADKTETPVLNADMRYLIFRPFWLVPSSIAKKELAPKIDRDPGYLARQNMEVVNGRIRQKPGPTNSLGLLKFILPNPFHVYLHDTPSKALFRRTRRDFSHGCIRVSDPPALAEFVLQGQTGWNRERIVQAMTSGPNNHRVDLQIPIPVYVFYTTVAAEPDGQVDFFADIYGQDATLQALLAKGYPRS